MYADVHCHLNNEAFAEDLKAVIARAKGEGVNTIVNVGWDLPSSEYALQLARQNEGFWAVVGVHPQDAKDIEGELEPQLKTLAQAPQAIAIGEIGLDYHYLNSPKAVQQEIFRRQLSVATELGLPVVIHSREATEDTLEILGEFQLERCLLHCYSGSWETAQIAFDRGYYLSFGGPVTFKNSRRAVEVVEQMPLERLLLETDAPYLAPEPVRGKRNEPALIVHTYQKVAQLRGLSARELAAQIKINLERFFQLPREV